MFKIWDSFFADDANFFVGYPTKNGTYFYYSSFTSLLTIIQKNTLEN